MNPWDMMKRFGPLSGGGGGTDPYWANVVSLLHFDGANGSTVFTDQKGKAWSANGDAKISTAQSKFGGASAIFDGTGDFIGTADSTDWLLEVGDFTLEFWFRPAAIGTRQFLCGQGDIGATSVRNLLEITAAGKFRYLTQNATTGVSIFGSTTLSIGNWYHLAVTKAGTTWRIFVNGNVDGSVVDSFVGSDFAGEFRIGCCGSYNNLMANGYMDDFRATKGVARYTASFTPPSVAFPNN